MLITWCSGLPNEDSLPFSPHYKSGPVLAPPASQEEWCLGDPLLQVPAAFGGRTATAEQNPGLFCSLSAGSFAQSSLGHGSAEMPRVTLSCLFVWAASQADSSRKNGIFSFVRAGKIKCDLNSLLDLHQIRPPGHELSGSRGGAALPCTVRTFPTRAA